MKQKLVLAVAAVVLAGCCRGNTEPKQIKAVDFPEPPVEILTNEAVGWTSSIISIS